MESQKKFFVKKQFQLKNEVKIDKQSKLLLEQICVDKKVRNFINHKIIKNNNKNNKYQFYVNTRQVLKVPPPAAQDLSTTQPHSSSLGKCPNKKDLMLQNYITQSAQKQKQLNL